jgi:hypothetical protein
MERRSDEPARERWGIAIAKGVGVFALCVLLLVVVPDRLVAYLAPRTTPVRRDLAVVAVWAVGFVVCSWVFVKMQPRAGRR